MLQRDQAIAVGVRQASEENAVHHAEDRGVDTNAEGERHEYSGGEAGRATQRAYRVSDVLGDRAGVVAPILATDDAAVLVAHCRLDDGGITEGSDRLGTGAFGIDTRSDEFPRSHLDVKRDLTRDVAAHATLAKADPEHSLHAASWHLGVNLRTD